MNEIIAQIRAATAEQIRGAFDDGAKYAFKLSAKIAREVADEMGTEQANILRVFADTLDSLEVPTTTPEPSRGHDAAEVRGHDEKETA